jgi:ribosomal protein L11 methyltransferase
MALPQLVVLTRHPEFAEEILLAHGAQSVTQVDAADDPVLEPAPGEAPLWPRTRTIGLFDEGVDFAPVIVGLRETLPDGDAAIITSAELEEQDWIRIWLRDWQPLRFGAHLWVSPRPKLHEITDPHAIVVALDPGLAFGTGTHPSTALCLDWLAGASLAGARVLDYGCGSGLLAIAALKLGAARAEAVDIDPQALIATRDNALVNGVGPGGSRRGSPPISRRVRTRSCSRTSSRGR